MANKGQQADEVTKLPFVEKYTVVPGFRVLGFSALPGFRAQKSGNGAWSVLKMPFGSRAPLCWPFCQQLA